MSIIRHTARSLVSNSKRVNSAGLVAIVSIPRVNIEILVVAGGGGGVHFGPGGTAAGSAAGAARAG